jgi:hypothetical protein
MKWLFKIAWSVLLIGLIFQLLHLRFRGLLLTLGGLLLLIHSVIHLIKFAKSNLLLSLNYLTFTSITIYLILRLQYWSFAKVVFPITILIAIICFIMHSFKKTKFKLIHFVLLLYLIFFFKIFYTPSYKIYYFINLNSVLNSHYRNIDYYSWDKYSWFLYLKHKQTEAIEANQKAATALDKKLKNSNDTKAFKYKEIIKHHEQLLINKTWKDYRQ